MSKQYAKHLQERQVFTMPHAHTPGPWSYHAKAHDGFDGPSVQSEYGLVCSMPTPEDSEGVANARLIAAAPEMLEALRQAEVALDVLAEDIEDTYPTRAENTANLAMQLRSIIAQATGHAAGKE